MSQLVVNALSNCNVYLDGVGLLGRAAEVTVPQPKRMMTDYHGLGMMGRVEIPVGWDKLDGTIKWSSFDDTTLALLANSGQILLMSVLADLQTISAAGETYESPVIYNFSGFCKDVGKISFKSQELVEYTSEFTINHIELYVNGAQLYLFDAYSNQYIVSGVDQLAQYRANIGG
jgi:P2 family phage contractile tail tube protein